MALPLRCANCKSFITQQELEMRKPPDYPWQLTPDGARVAAELEAKGGEHPKCPQCGHRTLVKPS